MYCPTRRAVTIPHLVAGPVTSSVMASIAHRSSGDVAPHVIGRADGYDTGASFVVERAGRPADVERGDRDTNQGAVVETVALLEAAAIALGASDLTPESMGVARATGASLRACSHDLLAAAGLARLFHQTLLAACPNAHMVELICRQASETKPSARLIDVGLAELDRVADDHEAILDMVASGADRGDVERSLRDHTSNSPLCTINLSLS
jgi:DNA-binding GntR family transcriptional regulator